MITFLEIAEALPVVSTIWVNDPKNAKYIYLQCDNMYPGISCDMLKYIITVIPTVVNVAVDTCNCRTEGYFKVFER